MRTHFLNRLSIPGRDAALALEPDFDFFRARKVMSLQIDFGAGQSEFPSLRLVTEYAGDTRSYALTLRFEGVTELVLPQLGPALFMPEVEVEELDGRQLEGIRYEVVSHFERAFRCTCRDLTLMEFRPL